MSATPTELARQADVDAIFTEIKVSLERDSGLVDSFGWNLPLAGKLLSPRSENELRYVIEQALARAERRGAERALAPSWGP